MPITYNIVETSTNDTDKITSKTYKNDNDNYHNYDNLNDRKMAMQLDYNLNYNNYSVKMIYDNRENSYSNKNIIDRYKICNIIYNRYNKNYNNNRIIIYNCNR